MEKAVDIRECGVDEGPERVREAAAVIGRLNGPARMPTGRGRVEANGRPLIALCSVLGGPLAFTVNDWVD